jgi:hypothetical protein
VQPALPRGPSSHLGTEGADLVPVQISAATVDIHVRSPEPSSPLPEKTNGPEEENAGECEVGLEPVLNSTKALAKRRHRNIELVKSVD